MNKNIEEAVEKIDKTINSLKDMHHSWKYDGILVDVNRLVKAKESLLKSEDNRYTQKDLCNAYKKGHEDGVLNKPVLDEFSGHFKQGGEG